MQIDKRILNLSYSSMLTDSQKDLIKLNVQFDHEDFGLLGTYPYWSLLVRPTDIKVTSCIAQETIYLHRVVMRCPDDMVVDHIDGDGLNNKKINLRICTQANNTRNKSQNKNKKLYKGVTMRKTGMYRARITYQFIQYNLGDFVSAEQAALAYNLAAIKYFGEFAKLNLISP